MPVAKTKALISFTVTAKLVCAFVFTNAKCWFSHDIFSLFLFIFHQVTSSDFTMLADPIFLGKSPAAS